MVKSSLSLISLVGISPKRISTPTSLGGVVDLTCLGNALKESTKKSKKEKTKLVAHVGCW